MQTQKIKNFLKKIVSICKSIYLQKFLPLKEKIFQESGKEIPASDRKFLFLFFSWAFFLVFVFVFFLSGKNPLRLLAPFSLYDLPSKESLSQGKVFVSNGEGKVFEIQRRMNLLKGNSERNLLTLVGEVGEPPFYSSASGNESVFNETLKKLPNLQTSVISAWFLKNEKKLIVDLRESTISEEIDALKFRVDNPVLGDDKEDSEEGHFFGKKEKVDPEKRKSEIRKIRLTILQSTLLAIEKTIFANFPEIESLEFRLDGRKKDFPGLEYSLTGKKNRSN